MDFPDGDDGRLGGLSEMDSASDSTHPHLPPETYLIHSVSGCSDDIADVSMGISVSELPTESGSLSD